MKSSFAFACLDRVPLAGARDLRVVDCLVDGVVSFVAFLGDCRAGRDIVDSGRTQ